MKKRIRIGVKTNFPFGIFPNAGIAVKRNVSEDATKKLESNVNELRATLIMFGFGDLAAKIVFEATNMPE